jgi:hypothetical protein
MSKAHDFNTIFHLRGARARFRLVVGDGDSRQRGRSIRMHKSLRDAFVATNNNAMTKSRNAGSIALVGNRARD